MAANYYWHNIRRRLRSLGSDSLLLQQSVWAGVVYVLIVALAEVNVPWADNMVRHVRWSVVEYQPVISWDRLRSWGENTFMRGVPVLSDSINEPPKSPWASYVLPVEDGKISSRFGWRMHPLTGEKEFHQGIDIVGPDGALVRSIADGQVCAVEQSTGLGRVVTVRHTDNLISIYGHLGSVIVEPGQMVDAAETLGTIGRSGITSGTHLHLEIVEKGLHVDPAIMLELVDSGIGLSPLWSSEETQSVHDSDGVDTGINP